MKLIVGLGNPGEKYNGTRHNSGFMLVDELYERMRNDWDLGEWSESQKFAGFVSKGDGVYLLKPTTFMNESGRSVAELVNFYKIRTEEIYIVHDDLDITLGSYKIQHGKGPHVHNGLTSVEVQLGTDQFWNVRIGIENRAIKGNKGVPGVEYSLQKFTSVERPVIDRVINQCVDELATMVS